jgi:hypothetical protein
VVSFTLRPVYRRCKGPHPYVRVGLDAFDIVNQLELQTTDHEMMQPGGGSRGGSIWRVDGIAVYRGDYWAAVDG